MPWYLVYLVCRVLYKQVGRLSLIPPASRRYLDVSVPLRPCSDGHGMGNLDMHGVASLNVETHFFSYLLVSSAVVFEY